MSDLPPQDTGSDVGQESAAQRALARIRAADKQPGLLKAAEVFRRAVPGDSRLGKGDPHSVTRELGLTTLQVWQSLSEAQGRGRGDVDVAILFTDLVDFSSWALEAGDEAVVELLADVGAATEDAVVDNGGELVKRLGDGAMAVFTHPQDAVTAGQAAADAVSALEHDGYRPQLRAGAHLGRPRRVRGDYLGVDVNVAARVADAASGGELLVSGELLERIDSSGLTVKRKRRFKAKGAPKDLDVYELRGA